jgi:chloramphenicol-sensitive protein RarD
VFLFKEPYTTAQFTACGFIWLGIAVFTYSSYLTFKKEQKLLAK